ncbi:hypothetical protein EYR38_002259 [Pleurotus pulmonarius]|nr:hypothetical protein EYR38_002259 [Pleurotus pulmonarius]
MPLPTLQIFRRLKCSQCTKTCRSQSALTKHVWAAHSTSNHVSNPRQALTNPPPSPSASHDSLDSPIPDYDNDINPPVIERNSNDGGRFKRTEHPYLTGLPCDPNGQFLEPDTPPPPREEPANNDWTPFNGPAEFMMADLLYRKVEMSATNQNSLYEILGMMMEKHGESPPFANAKEMHSYIDAANIGGVPWQCLSATIPGDHGPETPIWKRKSYDIWYRDPNVILTNLLSNPDFDGEFTYRPYVELEQTVDGEEERHWSQFMSANFAWRQSATDRRYDNDAEFRKFKRQLYHASLSAVFESTKPAMSSPVVRLCPDGHYRRVIFDFGPVIADYPEQVMLAGIVQGWCTSFPESLDDCEHALPRSQDYNETLVSLFAAGELWDEYGIDDDIIPFTNDFPRADIHQLLAPDLLHQVIKGTFKDHLVEWVGRYLVLIHGKADAAKIMDEIDHRIAAVPPYPGLRHFPDGRRFKQWTGDDSKGLMKIYLPALVDLVPTDILRTFSAFLDFCYLARRTYFTNTTLDQLDEKLQAFHTHREVFRTSGTRPTGFSMPRQHALSHYRSLIEEFGAPYGLCSSITESRHITAVKKPWRRSNRYNALGQMLVTNQRLDKLAALETDYVARKMLPPPPNTSLKKSVNDDDDNDDIEVWAVDNVDIVAGCVELARRPASGYPSDLNVLEDHISIPGFALLVQRFLYDQLHPNSFLPSEDIHISALPSPRGHVKVFHSAIATFYAPSDLSGRYGMYRERIRCNPNWHNTGPRRDCAFVVEDDTKPGLFGMSVVRLHLLFSFKHNGNTYPCALVAWYDRYGEQPDPDTGLWVVKPDLRGVRHPQPFYTVIHIESLLRGAHLIPVYGPEPLPTTFKYQHSLNAFAAFFVNKFIDYHAHELLSS